MHSAPSRKDTGGAVRIASIINTVDVFSLSLLTSAYLLLLSESHA